MAEIQHTLADLIAFSSEQKPLEFGTAFDSLIQSKIGVAIDAKKIEMSQAMFNKNEAQDYVPELDTEEEQDG